MEIRGDEICVHVPPEDDVERRHRRRLREGLERGLALVVAKAVVPMFERREDPVVPFRIGLDFGTRYRRAGWGPGITIHVALMNLLAYLDETDRPLALYHELSAVGATRYLAAHAPTARTQGQTFRIAHRFSRGERLFEEG